MKMKFKIGDDIQYGDFKGEIVALYRLSYVIEVRGGEGHDGNGYQKYWENAEGKSMAHKHKPGKTYYYCPSASDGWIHYISTPFEEKRIEDI